MKITVRPARVEDVDEIKRMEKECRLSIWRESDYLNAATSKDWIFYVAETEDELTGFILARLITNSNHSFESSDTKDLNLTLDSNPAESESTNPIKTAEAEICNLAVKPQYRRHRIGLELLGKTVAAFAEHDSVSVFLEVRESNRAAISFYKNFGFEKNGRRAGYYSGPAEDALVLVLSI